MKLFCSSHHTADLPILTIFRKLYISSKHAFRLKHNFSKELCNSLLYGAPAAMFDALQRVQNILTCVVTQSARRSSAKQLLELLHWLLVRQWLNVLLTNWQLYATRQDRHRQQLISRHCSYHTFPLDHCGQATHRDWPFLELEQFLSAVLPLSLHRLFWSHCRKMSSRTP